jgi:hypothetical protein
MKGFRLTLSEYDRPLRNGTEFVPGQRRPLGRSVLYAFLALLYLSSLAAYNIGPIPIPWMAEAGLVALAVTLILYTNKVRAVPGTALLFVFMLWLFLLNVIAPGDYAHVMPELATLPYQLFIGVRYVNMFSFISSLYVVYWLLTEGYAREFTRGLVYVGLLVCLGAFYVYVAQIFHLPELPRTRAGTSGIQQNVTGNYSSGLFSYRRALGTFREPSHLAEWLLIPFFVSFLRKDFWGRFHSAILGLTLILTVSLTAIASITIGTFIALLITNPFNPKYMRLLGAAVIFAGFLYLALDRVVVGAVGEHADNTLAAVFTGRITGTLSGGFAKTDRAYVYELISEHPIPVVGYGLGNANIYGSAVTGNAAMMAFLSLYVNMLYAAGYLGFIFLALFLLRPVYYYIKSKPLKQGVQVPLILIAYVSNLVSFAVLAEELTTAFAVICALLAYQVWILRHRFETTKESLRVRRGAIRRLRAAWRGGASAPEIAGG